VQDIIFLGHERAPFTQVVFCAIMDRLIVIVKPKLSNIFLSVKSVLISLSSLLT